MASAVRCSKCGFKGRTYQNCTPEGWEYGVTDDKNSWSLEELGDDDGSEIACPADGCDGTLVTE